MFSLDKLEDNTKIYILGIINRHNNYNYTKIDYFNVYYNNELFNPFLDKLIDMEQSIYNCKYIDWYSCVSQYTNTKYNKYFNKWYKNYYNNNINNINNTFKTLYSTGQMSRSYKNRNDYLTISILYDIYNKDYLKSIYNDVPINLFTYLNEDVYVYELPADTKDFIVFGDYIHSLDHSVEEPVIKEMNEALYINKMYKKEVDSYVINLKDKKRYFYKKM